MLQAQLRGKLTRSEENLEDLLTSNVFGSIKYLQPEEALIPLLTSSKDCSGLASFSASQQVLSVDYSFWPWIQEEGCKGCEPDVLLTMQLSDRQKIIVLVEAKYLSDKSSEADEQRAPTDQLAREWDNLTHLANREKATPILLYVTADFGYPRKSIEDSQQEYLQKRKEKMNVFWISWRKFPSLFCNSKLEILRDLVEVLRRQGLVFFEGIMTFDCVDIKWAFSAIVNWDWSSYNEYPINWEYRVNRPYEWQDKTEPVEWRFDS
jgi:hypothetical protein